MKKKINFGRFIKVESIKVKHGSIQSLSFVINRKLAYLPDANKIYEKDYQKFKKLDYSTT